MMPSFEYVRARSIDEAISLLSTPEARIHAGGTDLLGCARDRVFPVARVVSIAGIKGIAGIKESPGGVEIGALATVARVASDPVVSRLLPGLAEAASKVASPQIRNQGTIGGNLCQKPRCWYYRGDFHCLRKGGDTCFAVAGESRFHCILGGENCYMVHPSDIAPALIALGGVVTAKGPGGTRRIALEDFYVSPAKDPEKETVLGPDEIVTGVFVPRPASLHYSSYRKIRARRSWDFALAGIGLSLQFDGTRVQNARVVLAAAAPVPWRSKEVEAVITGRALNETTIARAVSSIMGQANPLTQNDYKLLLFEAAIEEELIRARGRTLSR